MGIYDRDYYRREGPSFLDSFALRGRACMWLIGANIVCFILQLVGRQGHSAFTETLVLVPERVMSGEVWRLLTYAFLHENFVHIFFNMWLLWLFGGHVEELLGRWEFLSFYLVAALLGGIAYTVQGELGWQIQPFSGCLGASGAVTAVTILCACHYPSLTVLIMFVLPVPIWALAVFQVVQDSFGLLGGGERVAYSVHLAGAGFAGFYYQLHWHLVSLLPRFRSWSISRSRPRLHVYHGEPDDPREPVAVPGPAHADLDEHLEAKVDAVLAKVARSGQSSLTDIEKQILLRASELYKKRRS